MAISLLGGSMILVADTASAVHLCVVVVADFVVCRLASDFVDSEDGSRLFALFRLAMRSTIFVSFACSCSNV